MCYDKREWRIMTSIQAVHAGRRDSTEDPLLVSRTESTSDWIWAVTQSTVRSTTPHQIQHQLPNERSLGWRLGLDGETQWLYTMQCLQRDISQVGGCGIVALPPDNRVNSCQTTAPRRSSWLWKGHRNLRVTGPEAHLRSGIRPMCRNPLLSKRMVRIAATYVDSISPRKLVGQHYVTICVLFVETASWYSELYYWRFAHMRDRRKQ
mgnify:CR=1 FL=1